MKEFIRKYGLSFGLVALTIALIFIFKERGNVVESGTNSLLDFYSENLKPLIFEAELKNEDVFNFAFYRNLPLNEQKDRVLQISDDYSDNEIIEIKPAIIKENTNNYDSFVRSMELNPNEKSRLDSILASYKSQLNTYVFVSDNNTIAVDPKVGLLSKLVFNDIMQFAHDVSKAKSENQYEEPMYSLASSEAVRKVKQSMKTSDKREFVFLANDTTFSAECEINDSELKERIHSVELENAVSSKGKVELRHYLKSPSKPFTPVLKEIPGVEISRDENALKSRILVSDNAVYGLNTAELNDFKQHIEDISREYTNFNFAIGSDDKNGRIFFKFRSDNGDVPDMNFELNVKEITDLVTESIGVGFQGDFNNWEEFGLKIDSLSRNIELFDGDSLIKVEVNGSSSVSPKKKSN